LRDTLLYITLIFLILTANSPRIAAQDPYFFKIDKTQGLPSNSVYDIFQDSRGFMWFATGNGLCRYDGHFVNTYPGEFRGTKAGSLIAEDRFGRIWYSTFDGYLHYIENDTLKPLSNRKPIGFTHYALTQNSILVLEENAIVEFDLQTLKPIHKTQTETNFIASKIGQFQKLYVLTDSLRIYEENKIVKPLFVPKDVYETILGGPMIALKSEEIVLVPKYSPDFYVLKNNNLERFSKSSDDKFVQNISETDDAVWFCTTSGIRPYAKPNFTPGKRYFETFNITKLFRDKDGNSWFSTARDGILLVPDFNSFYYQPAHKITAIAASDSILFAGTTDGNLLRAAAPDFNFERIHSPKILHETLFVFADSSANLVFSMSSKLNIFDLDGKLILDTLLALKDICKINDSTFAYAATGFNGIMYLKFNILNNGNKVFKSFYREDFLNDINGKSVMYRPETDEIFISTNQGLYRIKDKKSQLVEYKNDILFTSKLTCIGGMIYALSSSELYKIDLQGVVTKIRPNEQLFSEPFLRMRSSGNTIFLISAAHIYAYLPESGILKTILMLNADFEFTDMAELTDYYVISSFRGIVIKPKSEQIRTQIPRAVITKLSDGHTAFFATRNTNSFQFSDDDVRIEFSAISFLQNGNLNLSFTTDNLPNTPLGDLERTADLRNLSYGLHTFRLFSGSTVIAETQIYIQRPFWLKWWFILPMFVLIFLTIRQFDKWRVQRIGQKKQEEIDKISLEKNYIQSKLAAIKSQMNPHFFFNALNTIQAYILSNDKKQAVGYLSKFASLTRTVLEFSEKDEISISQEINMLKLYLDLEKSRFGNEFSYNIHVDSNIETDFEKIPAMLLQPYIENAVKHGLLSKVGDKVLNINFLQNDSFLEIQIDDNGIGRKKSMELNAIKHKNHKSFATDATQNRIELLCKLHRTNISVEITDKHTSTQHAVGTLVTIKIASSQ